jgi:DNA-binding response OmpR family regulator
MRNILLVEDDSEITKLLKLHFDTQLYNLSCCSSAEEAISKAFSDNFNLIILDITLPDCNGMEICKNLRAKKIDTPIMMLTCHFPFPDESPASEFLS